MLTSTQRNFIIKMTKTKSLIFASLLGFFLASQLNCMEVQHRTEEVIIPQKEQGPKKEFTDKDKDFFRSAGFSEWEIGVIKQFGDREFLITKSAMLRKDTGKISSGISALFLAYILLCKWKKGPIGINKWNLIKKTLLSLKSPVSSWPTIRENLGLLTAIAGFVGFGVSAVSNFYYAKKLNELHESLKVMRGELRKDCISKGPKG